MSDWSCKSDWYIEAAEEFIEDLQGKETNGAEVLSDIIAVELCLWGRFVLAESLFVE